MHFNKVEAFLKRHNMAASGIPLLRCTGEFLRAMRDGLAGHPSSLMMIPTYLSGGRQVPREQAVIVMDAGGTKCNAILFDEELNICGRGLSGGVNTTQTSPEDSRANVVSCINQLFKDICPEEIACLYASFVGPVQVLLDELAKRTRVANTQILGEPKAGILAGALRKEGMLAIADYTDSSTTDDWNHSHLA